MILSRRRGGTEEDAEKQRGRQEGGARRPGGAARRGGTEEDAEKQRGSQERRARRQRRSGGYAARRARQWKFGENAMTKNRRVTEGLPESSLPRTGSMVECAGMASEPRV